jgi:cobalt-zinc-cadmium efflux system outer membrane protein
VESLAVLLVMSQQILRFLISALTVANCGTILAGHTSEGASALVTLDSVVAEALAKNPELNYYRGAIAAAKGERRTAVTIGNPEFSGQLGTKHARDAQTGTSGDGVAFSLAIAQPFDYPGRIALRKAIANHQIELAELQYAQFRAVLAAQTRATAYAIFVAQENAAASKEVSDRFQSLSEVVRQREPAGVTPLLEARIIEAQAAAAQRKTNEANLAVTTGLTKLNQLRGELVSTSARINAAAVVFGSPERRGSLLEQARAHSFDLRIRQVELAQQGFKISLARNEKYPAISVGPFYSQEQSGSVGDKERTVGLGVSLPLPLWNRNAGNIETAKARQQQAEASFAMTQREVERKVIENAAIYEVKVAELSRWGSDGIGKLREAAELADHHYRLGAVPLTTYVEIQKQYLESIEAMLNIKKDALQAVQELEILTGLKLYKGDRQR